MVWLLRIRRVNAPRKPLASPVQTRHAPGSMFALVRDHALRIA